MKALIKIAMVILPIAILVVLGFGGAQVIASLKPPPAQTEETVKGLAVFAEPIERISINLDVNTQGEVRPKREITVAPQISGRIAYVAPNFQEGGFIRQGQVLVSLEAADYELAVVRAKSTVASAEQRLAREQAEAAIAAEEISDLGITDASPLALREPQLAEARASLDAAKAQLRDAELALGRTRVTAPFDGRVRDLNVNIGQFVSPGQSLGRVFGTDAVEVVLPLSDNELGRLGLSLAFEETADDPGPSVVFTTQVAGMNREWNGRVTRTAAAVDARTRLISAIAEVQDPYGKGSDNGTPMAPGLFVDAKVSGRSVDGVLRIPRQALRGIDQVYVYHPEDGTLSIRTVSVLYSDTNGAYLTAGVEAGEMAITSPMQSAFDGMKVTLANADATRGTATTATATAEQADGEGSVQ